MALVGRAISALLRHALVRRLLVVGGLLIAGWLLGGTGQAQADVAPVGDRVGAVLDEVTRAAAMPRPEPQQVVRQVVGETAVHDEQAAGLPQKAAPVERPKERDEVRKPERREPVRAERAPAPDRVRVDAPEPGRDESRVDVPRPERPAPSAPVTPVQDDTTGHTAPSAPVAGLPSARVWDAVHTRAIAPPPAGVRSPVVRTAADEPSLSPD